ncbi:hypothetical protein EPR50_G00173900 [Perca flavescens]|uniref:Adenomatous polyposis coli N-terminal dimerisation domain-containing protein n=1 Tax=Perca flavescens TaxID=8167 RepID=A0A484CKE7_PERFV|nr:hypothetical protein EPR50_G00173900 [Perca flavescens]
MGCCSQTRSHLGNNDFGRFQVSRGSSNMAAASYDQLLRQVEVLKMENSNLRQELQDNSNHLTKLETEASNMKVSTTDPN